jgi:hypothetical protein
MYPSILNGRLWPIAVRHRTHGVGRIDRSTLGSRRPVSAARIGAKRTFIPPLGTLHPAYAACLGQVTEAEENQTCLYLTTAVSSGARSDVSHTDRTERAERESGAVAK